jgi:hypothetical protein
LELCIHLGNSVAACSPHNSIRGQSYGGCYNIAFVNSERWLAKSCVHITQCLHGNVGKFLYLYFFVLYYKTNIKHFFPDWNTCSYINLAEIGKTPVPSFASCNEERLISICCLSPIPFHILPVVK